MASASSNRISSLSRTTTTTSSTTAVSSSGITINDRRIRIKMMNNSPIIFYKDSTNTVLSPLAETNGLVFPYQPKLEIGFAASYQQNKVTHNNFTFYSYENSEIKPFTLTCDFPARNQAEGRYVIAAKVFLESLTMMFTGQDGIYAGAPPMVVSIQGLGYAGLDYLPVSITDVSISYPDDVDYVSISMPNFDATNKTTLDEITKLPIISTFVISCTPMFSRAFSSKFSTLNFSSGKQRLVGPTATDLNDNAVSAEVSAGDETTLDTESASLGLLDTQPTTNLKV